MKNAIIKLTVLSGVLLMVFGFSQKQTFAQKAPIPSTSVQAVQAQKNESDYVKGRIIVKFKSDGPNALEEDAEYMIERGIAFKDSLRSKSESLDKLNKRYKVKKAKGLFQKRYGLSTRKAKEKFNKRVSKAQSKLSKTRQLKKAVVPDLTNVYVLEIAQEADVQEAVAAYQSDPHVAYVQPDYEMIAYFTPNDPYFQSSGTWGQTYDDLWGLKADKMNMPLAWNNNQGEGVIVAVIDTGLDYNHEDIVANIWTNSGDPVGDVPDSCNRVADPTIALADDDCNGYTDDFRGWDFVGVDNDPMDGHGHGTHVSGTIAAVGNNSLGIVGVAPKAKIMALKGLSDGGSGSTTGLAEAIVYAVDNGAAVINNSWGCSGGCPSNPLAEDATRYAHALGSVVVFAAGNDDSDVRNYSPQNIFETVTVGASDEIDGKASFSNWGQMVDVSAPGGGEDNSTINFIGRNILSLRAAGTDMYGDGTAIVGTKYYRARGTSMACPNAAGVAALLVKAYPNDFSDAIKARMMASADPFPVPIEQGLGTGRVDAYNALTAQPKPFIIITQKNLAESIGNGNGIPESGERIALTVSLKNLWASASSVMAVLSPSGADVTMVNAMSDYGTILSGATKDNFVNPFIFDIGDIVFDTTVSFTLYLNVDGSLQEISFNVDLGIKKVIPLPSYTNDLYVGGDHVVYWVASAPLYQVFLHNLVTDETINLSTDPNDSLIYGHSPDIFGNYVVWGEESIISSETDIMRYNIDTRQTEVIYSSPTSKRLPKLRNNILTWSENVNGNWDIFMRDLLTGQNTRITTDPKNNQWHLFDGTHVYWLDYRHSLELGETDIYKFNVNTGIETRITSASAHRERIRLSSGKIVFHQSDYRFGNFDIYMIDLTTLEEKIIADGPSEQTYASIWNDIVVWTDNRNGNHDIFMYDLSRQKEIQVTSNDQFQAVPDIWENKIVWIDRRNGGNEIYYTELDLTKKYPADLIAPAPDSTLTASTVTFTWSKNDAEDSYVGFHVGSDPLTPTNIYSNPTQTGTSVTITDSRFLSGDPVLVLLVSRVNGQLVVENYTLQTGGTFSPAIMQSPVPGSLFEPTIFESQIPGADVPFNWSTGFGVNKYWLKVIANSYGGNYPNLETNSVLVENIAVDGYPVIIQLWSEMNGEWIKKEYIYQTNYAPVLDPIGSQAVEEGQTFVKTIQAMDINGPQKTWSINVVPDTLDYTFLTGSNLADLNNLSISSSTPPGLWSITIKVEDPQGLSDQETFSLKVGHPEETPWSSNQNGTPMTINLSWSMGYHFTPQRDGTITQLGGYFNGSSEVILWNKTTGEELARTTVTSDGVQWGYAGITLVFVKAGETYTVAAAHNGAIASYRTALEANFPQTYGDIRVESSTYAYPSGNRPVSEYYNVMFGEVDIAFVPADPQTPWSSYPDGTQIENLVWDYTMGYHFTPNRDGDIVGLGALFDGSAPVRVWDKETGELLVETTVASSNNWRFSAIEPLSVQAGKTYTVAVYLGGQAGTYKYSFGTLPKDYGDVTIEASTYQFGDLRPTNNMTTLMFGQVDIQFVPTGATQAEGSIQLEAGRTANAVVQDWYSVNFQNSFTGVPVVVAAMETTDGGDSAGVRMNSVTATGMSVKIEEEQSANDEIAHTTEVVGYLASSEGTIKDASGAVIGEVGKLTTSHAWATVNLVNSYTNPVVVAQGMTFNGGQAAHARIQNVGSGSFEVKIEEWEYLDGGHAVETVGYVVLEKGAHAIADGTKLDAGTVSVGKSFSTVNFAQSFATSPVVVSRTQTVNEAEAVVTRQRSGTATSFQVSLEEEEALGAHVNETVGYIAIGN